MTLSHLWDVIYIVLRVHKVLKISSMENNVNTYWKSFYPIKITNEVNDTDYNDYSMYLLPLIDDKKIKLLIKVFNSNQVNEYQLQLGYD